MIKKQALIAGVAIATVFIPFEAEAISFSGLYVFGDSLSDAGEVFQRSGFPPSPPYAQRFSNGPVWVEYLGAELGLTPTLFNQVQSSVLPADGINFATGGATTGTENTLALTPSISPLFPSGLPALQQQVSSFISFLNGQSADPNALFIVWAGANDYLPTEGTFSPAQSPQQPLTNILAALQTLDSVGVKNVLLPNLPDLGNTPLGLRLDQQFPTFNISENLNTLAAFHNAGLLGLQSQVGPNLNLIPLDVNSLVRTAIAPDNPFGFTNATEPCFDQANPFGSLCAFVPGLQSQYVFWDLIHPTTAAHQQIGKYAFSVLQAQQPIEDVPEPASVLGLLTVSALAAGSLRRKTQTVRQTDDQKVRV